MPRYKSISILIILILLAGACYTSNVSLNILVPASYPLNPEIKRISILPVPGTPSAPGRFDDLRFVSFDTTVDVKEIKMGYLHGIYDIMAQSPAFDRIILSDSTGFDQKKGFYWDELKEICRKDSTDYVLVLNMVVATRVGPTFSMVEGQYIYEGDLMLLNYTKWSVYNPANEVITERYQFTDTTRITGGFSIGNFTQLLYENCFNVGKHCGEKLAPYWKESSRLYYKGPGKDLRDASEYVTKNQWYKASRIWNDMMTGYRSLKTSHAAYNMAVALEQIDDLDQALAWLDYSDSLKKNDLTVFYTEVLKSRKRLQTILDQQVSTKPFVPARIPYKSQQPVIPDLKNKKIRYYDDENIYGGFSE